MTRKNRSPSEVSIASCIVVGGSSIYQTEVTAQSSTQAVDPHSYLSMTDAVHLEGENHEDPPTLLESTVASALGTAIFETLNAKHATHGFKTPFREKFDLAIELISLASVQTWGPELGEAKWTEFAKNPSFQVLITWGEDTVKTRRDTVDLHLHLRASDRERYPQVYENRLWIGQTIKAYKKAFTYLPSLPAATTETL